MLAESNDNLMGMQGLDRAEAEARLSQFGPNVLQQTSVRGFVEIVRGTLREPMFLFLLAAATLYLVVGSLGEGLFLTGTEMGLLIGRTRAPGELLRHEGDHVRPKQHIDRLSTFYMHAAFHRNWVSHSKPPSQAGDHG